MISNGRKPCSVCFHLPGYSDFRIFAISCFEFFFWLKTRHDDDGFVGCFTSDTASQWRQTDDKISTVYSSLQIATQLNGTERTNSFQTDKSVYPVINKRDTLFRLFLPIQSFLSFIPSYTVSPSHFPSLSLLFIPLLSTSSARTYFCNIVYERPAGSRLNSIWN